MSMRAKGTSLPSDRSFGLTFAIVFALFGAWLLWKSSRYAGAAFAPAALFLVAAFAFPRLLHPLNVVWMRFGLLLNAIVSPVVMGVIYFVLLTPIAAFLRLRGRDVLRRRFDAGSASYWIEREPPGPDASSFPRQY